MVVEEGTTTASSSGGSPNAYVSRYALRAAGIERGDSIHWEYDEERDELVGRVVSDSGGGE
jgi:hypothetical protein